ncbi:GlsB/YeaQ/YmgE family stress response membrane protein [Paenibacillus sp. FSL M8-0212]|uniref:GlsB/YeaQ/YmgE family stress response membrane protein n=1 Tax=Paenibacillus sp. FSL M8-0212 TaxID=2921618 RepID=UPI004046DBDB
MYLIWILIVGGLIGWLSGNLIGRDVPGGVLGNIIAGFVGSWLGFPLHIQSTLGPSYVTYSSLHINNNIHSIIIPDLKSMSHIQTPCCSLECDESSPCRG